MVGSKEDSTASQASSEAITPSAVENVESMSAPSAVEYVESMSSAVISPVETVKKVSPSSGVWKGWMARAIEECVWRPSCRSKSRGKATLVTSTLNVVWRVRPPGSAASGCTRADVPDSRASASCTGVVRTPVR
jgi:hypothetical protein